jgi:hypothetical protein
MTQPNKGLWVFLVAAFTLVLAWPALYNGQAFFHSDTPAYVRGAAAGIEALTGISSQWSTARTRPEANNDGLTATERATVRQSTETNDEHTVNPKSAPDAAAGKAPSQAVTNTEFRSLNSLEDKTVLSGRSVYYGALLYLGAWEPRFLLPIVIQSALVVIAMLLVLDAVGLRSVRAAAAILGVLAITPVTMFTSTLMPDLFAGLTILCCASVASFQRSTSGARGLFWFGLMTFALLCHTSHVLIAVALLLGLCIVGLVTSLRVNPKGLVMIASAVLVALLGEMAFNAGVGRFLGQEPIRPPFLMARTIADGPGTRFLERTCPSSEFFVCQFVDRLPLSADDFLWNPDPQKGVFATVDAASRRALSDEQLRFYVAAISAEPGLQIASSLKNAGQQLISIQVGYAFTDWGRRYFEVKLPTSVYSVARKTKAFRDALPDTFTTYASYGTSAVAVIVLLMLLYRSGTSPRGVSALRPDLTTFALVIVCGALVNAFVCGAFSSVHDRYQARVIWLLPLLAGVLVAYLWSLAAHSRRDGV